MWTVQVGKYMMGTDFHCYSLFFLKYKCAEQYDDAQSTLGGMKNHEKEVKWKKEKNIITFIYMCTISIVCNVHACVWLLKFHEGTSPIELNSKAMKRLTFGRHFKAIACFMIFSLVLLIYFFSGVNEKNRRKIYYERKKHALHSSNV